MIRLGGPFFLIAAGLVCGSCAATTGANEAPKFQYRPLSPTEKQVLAKSLASTLKDPDAAQFRWMPAIVVRAEKPIDIPIGYCGLVNGKNSYGGYVGFKRFYATLTRNEKGEFARGTIEHIEGRPITFGSSSTIDEAWESGAVEGSCRAWGYTDLSLAN